MNSQTMIEKLKAKYGLSAASAINIFECVESYQNYDKLPIATKEALQCICDLFNVNLTFTPLKRGNMALTGIYNNVRASYLYTTETLKDRDEKKHWPKNNDVDLVLMPNANHMLKKLCRKSNEFIN